MVGLVVVGPEQWNLKWRLIAQEMLNEVLKGEENDIRWKFGPTQRKKSIMNEKYL